MLNKVRIVVALLSVLTALEISAQETPVSEHTKTKEKSEKQKELEASGDTALKIIESLDLPADVAKQAIAIIKGLLITTRADQQSIYLFVRGVNENLVKMEAACRNEPQAGACSAFVENIRKINQSLVRSSYTDSLFQNGNLSNQIKTRLPLLLADSAKLISAHSNSQMEDFTEEVTLLSVRFLSSKRFRAGIGVSYSYLPQLTYKAVPRVDFSPFQSTLSGGSDLVIFNTEFSNKSIPALLLSAEVPLMQIDVGIPNSSYKQTTTTTVQQRRIDATRDLLARTSIESELKEDYDVTLRFSALDILNWVRQRRGHKPLNWQFDYGMGIGMTGFEIKDAVSTDVRVRTNPASTFNELTTTSTLSSANSSSFNTWYLSAHYTFRVSDEFQIGMEARFYEKDRTSTSQVDVGDVTVSLRAVWYPTFNW